MCIEGDDEKNCKKKKIKKQLDERIRTVFLISALKSKASK